MPTRDKRYIIESYLTQGRQYLKVDDILQVEGTETFTDTFADKFQIFKSNTNWGAKIRLYNMVLEKNGVRKRNLIPCYSTAEVANSVGEICPIGTKGLYDLVENKFYTNRSPSGDDFTAGPIVE